MSMEHLDDRDVLRQRELSVLLYLSAFECGDLDALAAILAQAERDPELDRLLVTVNAELHEEAALRPLMEEAQTVRKLLLRHLPSAFPQEETGVPDLTIGVVAARLHAEEPTGRPLPPADRRVNEQLLNSSAPLPPSITAATIKRLAKESGLAASDRYWELFRRAALALSIGRERTQVQLAAARTQRRVRRRRSGHEAPPVDPEAGLLE